MEGNLLMVRAKGELGKFPPTDPFDNTQRRLFENLAAVVAQRVQQESNFAEVCGNVGRESWKVDVN